MTGSRLSRRASKRLSSAAAIAGNACSDNHRNIIKKENMARCFLRPAYLFAPAYPLEEIFDPTGAGVRLWRAYRLT